MRIGTVKEIWRYPVKSMAGEQIESTTVGALGVPGDRAWALRDEEAGEIRGAKKIPGLLHFAARYLGDPAGDYDPIPIAITTPDGTTVSSEEADVSKSLSAAVGREVTLVARPDPQVDMAHYLPGKQMFDDPMENLRHILGLEGDDPIPDLSGLPANLREYIGPLGTYFDCFPLHILTTASLDELQRLSPEANFDVRRFRPNVLLEADAALTGFAESDWGGRTLRIGEVVIEVNTSAVRCSMPMQSQQGLEFDKGTLRTVKDHNGQHVGIYCSVTTPGAIAVGDEATLD